MSTELMNLVWEQRIPPARKMVLLALAYSSNRDGVCFLPIDELSQMAGVDQQHARGHLDNLVRTGYVQQAPTPALCRVVRDRLRGGVR